MPNPPSNKFLVIRSTALSLITWRHVYPPSWPVMKLQTRRPRQEWAELHWMDQQRQIFLVGLHTKKKKTMNTFIHNLPLSSLRWKALYFQLSRINKVDGNFLYWQISLSLVCPLRNHVTLRLSHLSLSACKDGGYRE